MAQRAGSGVPSQRISPSPELNEASRWPSGLNESQVISPCPPPLRLPVEGQQLVAIGRVVEADRSIGEAGDQPAAVGAERQRTHLDDEARDRPHFTPGLRVEDAQSRRDVDRLNPQVRPGEPAAVGAERQVAPPFGGGREAAALAGLLDRAEHVAVGRVPELHDVGAHPDVRGRRGHRAAVGAEPGGGPRVVEGRDRPARLDVPEPGLTHRHARGDEPAAVGAERRRGDGVARGRLAEGAHQLAGGRVPDVHHAGLLEIKRVRRGDPAAVAAHGQDRVVARDRPDLGPRGDVHDRRLAVIPVGQPAHRVVEGDLVGLHADRPGAWPGVLGVPELDGVVVAGRGQAAAVLAEGDGVDRPGVASVGRDLRARPRIPEPHGLIIAGRGQGKPVGTEGQAADRAVVPPEDRDFLARSEVPDPGGPILGGRGQACGRRG